jgi:SAM-dependent methyltransferase
MRIASSTTRPTTTGFLVQRSLTRDLRTLLATLSSLPKGILLDVGCGNAPYGDFLPQWQRVGINIDADDANPEVVGDGLALPFRNACVDAVLCTQVVEHVRNPFVLVSEIARVLKPGGRLILSGPMYWPLHEVPHDYWRFTEYGFKELCRQAGLEVQTMLPQGHAIALTAMSINHVFRGHWFLPVRLVVNITAWFLDKLIPIRHSTANLILLARKLD